MLPTLADLSGIELRPAKRLDGVSLKPLLLENNPEWNERYIFNHWGKQTSVRSQKYRLDNEGNLFDMINDPGQNKNVSVENPEINAQLLQAKQEWENEVLSELPETDTRTFTIAHPDFVWTQIPARDGTGHGNIQRSSIIPIVHFLPTGRVCPIALPGMLKSLSEGDFEVTIYYTCPAKDVGSTFRNKFRKRKVGFKNFRSTRSSVNRNGTRPRSANGIVCKRF